MEIVKYESNLPAISQEILKALESPLVKNSTDEEVKQVIVKGILKSHFDLRFSNPSEKDLPLMVNSILNNIRLELFAIRINEIPIAFSRGVLKEYGDFMGLSIATFSCFVKSYLINNARLEALKEKNKPLEVRKEPTEQEKFNMAKDNALRAYNDIKTDRDISLYASAVYDFLDVLQLIVFSNPEKKEFYQKAKEQLIRENQIKATGKVDQFMLAKIKKVLSDLQSGEEKDLTKIRAKVLACNSYLKSVIDMKIDFEELLSNHSPDRRN